MLNFIQFKKIALVGMMAFAPLSVYAQVAANPIISGIPDGSYKGKFVGADHGGVHMIVDHVDGCASCFVAKIFTRHEGVFKGPQYKIEVYKVVPQDTVLHPTGSGALAPTNYTLTPLHVNKEDGEILPDSNPSLVLAIGTPKSLGTKDVEFTLVQANGRNIDGFGEPMRFTCVDHLNKDEDAESGRLYGKWEFRSKAEIGIINVSAEDHVTRTATVTDFGGIDKGTNGQFILEEKAPDLFTYQRNEVLASGELVNIMPDKLVIFMKRGGTVRALVVNPDKPGDVFELRVKN